MGRIEKKFQKKKERERAVRKKILLKRAAAHKTAKEIEAQDRLEREVNKAERRKQQPIRRSPELEKTLELVEKIKADEEKQKENEAALAEKIRGRTKDMVLLDDAMPVVGFAPEPGK